MPATMHIIPFSHFNEKGMWILDYKGIPYNTKQLADPAKRGEIAAITGGSTSLPVFHDGNTVIDDTTALALIMDERQPESRLIPATEPDRNEVLMWEDWLDNSLGVHLRRWLFHHLRTERPDVAVAVFMSMGMSKFKATLGWRLRGPTITKALGANAVSAKESSAQVTQTMEILTVRLQDRDYLVGESFTLADLTACALLSPATLVGPWLLDGTYPRVTEWRRGIMEQHGRRALPTDPIPDQAERTRRREALLSPAAA